MLSLISTLPLASKIFNFLLYKNSSAIITIPSKVEISPLLVPLNLLPFSRISISAILKLNCSTLFALKQNKNKNKNNIRLNL